MLAGTFIASALVGCWLEFQPPANDAVGFLAFAHSETVIESQCQNAPGTLIGLACKFKQLFDLIYFKVSSAVYLNRMPLLVEHHKTNTAISRYG